MVSRIELRQATESDADLVGDVYLASRSHFLSYARLIHSDEDVRQWITRILIPKGNVCVALLDGNIIGMMVLSKQATSGWIDQLYLLPAFVGLGVGTQLVTHAKQILGAPIRLYTFQANDGARRFYERNGFSAVAYSDGSGNEERCPDILYEWRV